MTKYVEISAPNNKAWLSTIEGIVTHHESHRWSSTQVQSSGGGGYVGGYIEPLKISSIVTQHQKTEIWIEDDDGSQQQFLFSDDKFPVALGHRVRVVWGGSTKNKENGTYLFAHNFTSKRLCYFDKFDGFFLFVCWPFKHKLIKMPLLYRVTFYYAPIVIWLLFSLMLIVVAPNPFYGLANAIFFSLVWTFISIFWLSMGWSLFGYWWSKKILEPFRERVFQVYNLPL